MKYPEDGYAMTGPQFKALCDASGRTVRSFARVVGIDGRKLRAHCQINFSEDIMAVTCIDQMRDEAKERGTP